MDGSYRKTFDKWLEILRLKNNWNILLEERDDPAFKKRAILKLILMIKKRY